MSVLRFVLVSPCSWGEDCCPEILPDLINKLVSFHAPWILLLVGIRSGPIC
ncbi:conserved hypothetical protein [Ricinus communis]|uniref:Uncharacterized protein n=1 Tax=Ricinus communis TaxID=3988 RepID=B9SQZ4_RICCO|nr:conserved hypothetical protein [Ricinus communis]